MATRPQEMSPQCVVTPMLEPAHSAIVLACSGAYEVRIARAEAELQAALRLRFRVFNLELHEGLQSAYATGLDRDCFDEVCDHIVVVHTPSEEVVGTYRVQTGANAAANAGYYSEREFDFGAYEYLREEMLELGRACVHPEHRSFDVLVLLWRGVAIYANLCGSRYLVGCSSLTSQDPAVGSAAYRDLSPCLVEEHLRTTPTANFEFAILPASGTRAAIPKLLRTYMAIGAQICGAPAIDREFGTIDFLTVLDLERLASPIKARLFGS
jgi:putative hemolysin